MSEIARMCDLVKEQCDPSTSEADIYVGLEHIDPGSFRLRQVGAPCEVRSAKTCFRKGEILYGKLRPYLDKAVVAERDGICSTDILVLRPKEGVNAVFLLGLLHSKPFIDFAMATTHGVNHPRTSWSAISQFTWDIPTHGAQEKIAAVLWKIQRAIEVEEKLIATTRELKQAAMRQLFTRGLRGERSTETEVGPVPSGWRVVPFAELREFLQYGTSAKCEYAKVGNPVIRIPNVVDGRVGDVDLKYCQLTAKEIESLVLKPGDVLFIRTNGVRDRVGTCAVYKGVPERALFASYLIRARLDAELDPAFFQYFTCTPAGISFLGGRASPAADGKFNVNTKLIDAILVPVAPIEEQREIVQVLQTVDRKFQFHERKRSTLQELFKTMLHQLMTGQIRVDKLDIDVSEVRT